MSGAFLFVPQVPIGSTARLILIKVAKQSPMYDNINVKEEYIMYKIIIHFSQNHLSHMA